MSGSREGAGGIGGLLAFTQNGTTNTHYYYHTDRFGNVTGLVDTNAYVVARYEYDPFGRPIVSYGPVANAQPYGFSSKYHHRPSGIVLYERRPYLFDPQRFATPDPLGELFDLNLYRFNYNSPPNDVDPNGKHPLLIAFLVGFVLNAVMTPYNANAPGLNAETYPPADVQEILANGLVGGVAGAATEGLLRVPGGMPPKPGVVPCKPKAPDLTGQNFGKLGTVVKNPELDINGFTKHGIDQTITRGVSPQNLLSTVNNPTVVLQQSGGQYLLISDQAAVVLSPGGQLITTYPSSMFNANVNAVLTAASPK